jgi:oligopeptidase B
MPNDEQPPFATRKPTVLSHRGDDRVDDWYWLREKTDPEVIKYLEDENAYTKAVTAHTDALQDELFEEIKSRILETDLSAPVPWGEWMYYSRTEEGQQYGIFCRKPKGDTAGDDGAEQILLDQNVLAAGHDYFAVGVQAISPEHDRLAYATDTNGSEKYELHFRDLTTGEDHDDVIADVYYGQAWASDNRTFFYVRPDHAMRPYQVWRHTLGTPTTDDALVYQEDDERFFLGVSRSRSGAFILLTSNSKMTTEIRFLPADQPDAEPTVVHPKEQGLEYDVEDHIDRFFIVTNADGAENFKLMEAPVTSPGRASWTEVIAHRPEVKLDGIDVFADHIALYERTEGLRRIAIRSVGGGETHVIEQPETVYTASGGSNLEFETSTLRYGYTSLVTPSSVYDYDVNSRERTLIKQQPVLGDFSPEHYDSERVWAKAEDGEMVPISLLYKKGLKQDGTAPCLLYGYGSYEISIDPSFSSVRLSLVDRGFVFAIAHIRGGGEMGRQWYENGKFLKKVNTFTDFIACAEHLVSEGYTSPDRLVARGGSAGGLLMGAVTNRRADLFRAVVAEVPFVDCLTTMLDSSLPLTIPEYEEWGNPEADGETYEYMKSYSPYDNVEIRDYPWMLVTAGLNDPRVSYWEPAKWVAKLRATKTDDNPLLLKTEMGAGHGGPSGRYDAWKDEAFVYAFMLEAVGLT